MNNKLKYFFCIIFFICFFMVVSVNGESVIIQKGIAFSETETINTEELRQRAIRNALELSLMQVNGLSIAVQKTGESKFQETTKSQENGTNSSIMQKNRFSAGVTTQTRGHAKLLKILKEWQEGRTYFVEAQISVIPPGKEIEQKRCGDYWIDAGKPSIYIEMDNKENGNRPDPSENRNLRYFKDVFVKNGVQISTDKNISQYLIVLHQTAESEFMENFDAFTTNCTLSYQIYNTATDTLEGENRISHGPQAGFSQELSTNLCFKAVAPVLSEKLIRDFAVLMNDRWINGVEKNLEILNLPGNFVPAVSDIINNLYQLTFAGPVVFENQVYTRKIRFKGNEDSFIQSIQDGLDNENWQISLREMNKHIIRFMWSNGN